VAARRYGLSIVGRPAKFDRESILDAAAALVAEAGPGAATVVNIAQRIEAPTGSIYHRFASRELVLAHVWLRAVRGAQLGFVAALNDDDVESAAGAAINQLIGWTRAHLDEATVLLLYRRRDLAERWSNELGAELADLNVDIAAALRRYARRRFGRADRRTVDVVRFALVDVPYAAIRRHLVDGVAPPRALEDLVITVANCVLRTHDAARPS